LGQYWHFVWKLLGVFASRYPDLPKIRKKAGRSDMNCIIDIKDVWKKYPMRKDRPGFKEALVNLARFINRSSNSYFWALKGVSFEVDQGDCLGIIGKNGAGKSTLLSLILGTIYPNKGGVTVSKRITPLLGLGAGFHPELTGKENILINGVLLGLTKEEVEERMDDIIAFSEIEAFINMPARTYSSGMYLRLAFSVAIHTDPKLLLIDEVLAVGDEAFKKKSKQALLQLIKGDVTTVLVSHNPKEVQEICNRVIWLEGGEIKAEGGPGKVVKEYLRHSG
jgi:ABC-type polysaccharide/polyol phosphate transport system ATPase subunit